MSTPKTAKRGDTFALTCERKNAAGAAFNITSTTISAKMRRRSFVADLTVTKTDATNGVFALSATATATAAWPPGLYKCDVQFTDGADVRSSMTFDILVEEDVTY
jgi:hypothetical protein